MKKNKKAVKDGLILSTFWIDEKILKEYQERYPRTLSAVVRYYLENALHNEKIVTQALFKGNRKKTIFDED